MPTHTIKITGVPGELLRLLDARVKQRHAVGRSEYVRELIRKDVLEAKATLREILAPIHAESARRGTTEEEIDSLVDEIRNEAYAERTGKRPR